MTTNTEEDWWAALCEKHKAKNYWKKKSSSKKKSVKKKSVKKKK
tara:strand:+ start:541 stop:672 length:132 start_codon:yes stop_codon:yes gene_type:complete